MNKSTPFYKMAEFWIAVVDAVISITLKIVNLYAPNETLQLVEFIISQVQPIMILIIISLLGARVAGAVRSIASDVVMQIKSGDDA